MTLLFSLVALALTAEPEPAPWELATDADGINVYARPRAAGVQEVKATGLIDAPPSEVWKALRDYEHYPKTMPYTEEAKVLSREEGDKVIYFYSVINAPLVDRRDYVIRIVDETDAKDGKGALKVSWTISDKGAPAPRSGVVRVTTNDGYWLIEPRENGAKSFATYYLFTDPGGSIPRWIVNRANRTAVPDVFRCVRKVVAVKK